MKRILLFTIASFIYLQGFSQGCSDAGFCSLGALKEVGQENAQYKNHIDFGLNYGLGEANTSTINPYVQYGRNLGNSFSILGKLTGTYASGFLGSKFNVGDFYAVGNYNLKSSRNNWNFIGGLKVPLTTANDKNSNGKPLPLDYQSSIGTFDLILGSNYIYKNSLEVDAALQAPLAQHNKSTFFTDEYTDERINKFTSTNNFRRRADVLLRIGYYIKLATGVTVKPNLLGIYHLGKDTFEDRTGNDVIISGSEGFTLNGGFVLSKTFRKSSRLELIAATPFAVRKVRPDGLTREFAVNIQYSIPF
ncbi:hypothetical protein H7F33_02995 [Pedobacter sp. PAMC26386]|nr:hypothetical protein H7F33_02995 [Pedobacter sp. PAMC26386]